MPRRAVARFVSKILALSLPVMFGFAVVLVIVGRVLYHQGEELLGQPEERQIEVQSTLIRSHLEKAVSDLRFVANGYAMRAWLNDPQPNNLSELRHDLLQLVREKPVYLQARLLGTNGMELVRAEAVGTGRSSLVQEEELQSKADRPYFSEAIKLSPNEIYISPLDLNIENGKIEVPFRPTARLSMPLFDHAGKIRGILVFNLQGSVILGGLRSMVGERGGWEFLLTNSAGYWLVGPTPDSEWGFQIPSRAVRTMPSFFPRAWEAIRSKDYGKILTDQGMFIFSSIYPNEIVWKPTFGFNHSDQLMTRLRATRWVLVAHLPVEEENKNDLVLISPLLIAFGVGSLIIITFAFILAKALTTLEETRRKERNQAMALSETVMNLQQLIQINDQNIAQLRQANSRLESVLNAAKEVSVIVTDEKGLITLFNPGAEKMLGYSAKEMVGKISSEHLHIHTEMIERGEELTKVLGYPVSGFSVFVESARLGGFESREWTYVRKDGSLLTVELVLTAINNDVDGITGYLGIAVDVTERNRALRELESSRARLSSVVKTAADGIFTVDTVGVILSVNKSGAAIFDYTPTELVGQKVNILMPEPYRSLHDKYIVDYLETGGGAVIGKSSREMPGLRRNGEIVPLELAITEVKTESEHFFTGIMRDITKRKKAEAALLKANEALVEKQRVLDDDMRAAAHIQRSLLPQRAPTAYGFVMDWFFLPSTHVGGDIFNVLPLPDGKIGVYLIDVSGHGPAAAMVTVSISQVMQINSEFVVEHNVALDPDEVLRRVDKAFPIDRFDRFSTMFYLIYDPSTRILHSAGAGHPPPLLARKGEPVIRLEEGGTVIGMGEMVPFVAQKMKIEADDVLLLYTDGCNEHTNPAGEQFGISRLEAALAERIHLSPAVILNELHDELDRFGEGAKPDDDVSLVCLKFTND